MSILQLFIALLCSAAAARADQPHQSDQRRASRSAAASALLRSGQIAPQSGRVQPDDDLDLPRRSDDFAGRAGDGAADGSLGWHSGARLRSPAISCWFCICWESVASLRSWRLSIPDRVSKAWGASREAFFSALTEPILFAVLVTLVRLTGEMSLTDLYRQVTADPLEYIRRGADSPGGDTACSAADGKLAHSCG